jgi:hypothetical protein
MSATESPSTDLTVPEGQYLALSQDPVEIEEIIAENLGGQEITEFDLPKVKVPSGGGTTWELPPNAEPSKVLSGIVVYFKLTRQYWDPKAGSGTPPQCRSSGGIIGIGTPGGDCRTCPLAQFGTAVDEKTGELGPGQACNAKEVWFLLRPGGSYLPTVVALPATSMKAAKAYRITDLGSVGIRLSSVVTEITLVEDRNAKGDKYSRVVPVIGARLSDEEARNAAAYARRLRPIFDATAEAMAAEAPAADIDAEAEEI